MANLLISMYEDKSLLFSMVADETVFFFQITEEKEIVYQLLDINKGKSEVWLSYALAER